MGREKLGIYLSALLCVLFIVGALVTNDDTTRIVNAVGAALAFLMTVLRARDLRRS